MSKLTLEEAIKHCEVVAEQEECFINYPHSDIVLGDLDIESRKHYVAEQKQLAEWLTELKEARKLLKWAVEGFRKLGVSLNDDGECDGDCLYCPINNHGNCLKWEYESEALALIGEDGDAE